MAVSAGEPEARPPPLRHTKQLRTSFRQQPSLGPHPLHATMSSGHRAAGDQRDLLDGQVGEPCVQRAHDRRLHSRSRSAGIPERGHARPQRLERSAGGHHLVVMRQQAAVGLELEPPQFQARDPRRQRVEVHAA